MLVDELLLAARRHPGRVAATDDTGDHTFGQLAARAVGVAHLIPKLSNARCIGLMFPPGASFMAAFYGTLLAGRVVVALNHMLGLREIAHKITDCQIDTVLTVPALLDRLGNTPESMLPVNWHDLTTPPEPQVNLQTITPPAVTANDLVSILYTSGTSGLPKGVPQTYGNITHAVRATRQHLALPDDARFLGVAPPFHITGLLMTVLMPVHLAAPVVFVPRFTPLAAIEAIRDHRLTVTAMVPSIYNAMTRVKSATAKDLATLTHIVCGGEPMPAAVYDRFLELFGKQLHEGWGMTEAIGPLTMITPTSYRPRSCGRALPGAELLALDEHDRPLPAGTAGNIVARGPMVVSGYHNLPEVNSSSYTADGYLRTGDIGHVDQDGYWYITGRKKDLIIIGGEKVAPREIEELISTHPAVAEVAVIGRKDELRGEAVVAYVAPKDGQWLKPEIVRNHCRQHGLPTWKLPRDVHVLPELPKSPSGKILKRLLAEQKHLV